MAHQAKPRRRSAGADAVRLAAAPQPPPQHEPGEQDYRHAQQQQRDRRL